MTAYVKSVVVLCPPRSLVRNLPSINTLFIALVIISLYVCKLIWRNNLAPHSSIAVGLAKFLPTASLNVWRAPCTENKQAKKMDYRSISKHRRIRPHLPVQIHKFRPSNLHQLQHQHLQLSHRQYCQQYCRTDLGLPSHRTVRMHENFCVLMQSKRKCLLTWFGLETSCIVVLSTIIFSNLIRGYSLEIWKFFRILSYFSRRVKCEKSEIAHPARSGVFHSRGIWLIQILSWLINDCWVISQSLRWFV